MKRRIAFIVLFSMLFSVCDVTIQNAYAGISENTIEEDNGVQETEEVLEDEETDAEEMIDNQEFTEVIIDEITISENEWAE